MAAAVWRRQKGMVDQRNTSKLTTEQSKGCSIQLWTDVAIGWSAWFVSNMLLNLWFQL
ncbi:hypothetical protein HanPSC8_Chr08g0324661 [Helianthus annuus]|nr:hypothetical protein HanPSC8_Chr08g0324661 [Helianthus annuus]